MWFRRRDPDVLVVGAGPVGLVTALSLVRSGISVRVVDAASGPTRQSRALALHPATVRLLDRLGVLGEVLPVAHRVQTIGFYDGAIRRVELPLDGIPGEFSFVAVIGQDQLQAALLRALREARVSVDWNHRATEFRANSDRVRVTIERLTRSRRDGESSKVRSRGVVEVPFLIGADGHSSTVRRQLRIEFDDVGEAEYFAVHEFETDFPVEHELRISIADGETDVLWPLSGHTCRWSFQLRNGEIPTEAELDGEPGVHQLVGDFSVLGNGALRRFIDERAPWFEGTVEVARSPLVVRFQRRLARSFGRDRVWLVGDATHTHYPVGAQSMNLGMQEGCELAAQIIAILTQGESLASLERSGDARRERWRFLLGRRGCVLPGTPTDPWLSRHTQRLLSCLPASGSDLTHLAHELGLQVVGRPEG